MTNYINNDKTNFGVFVSHRINEIRNISRREEWLHVPTNQNVVDDLTCYKGFDNLTNRSRWCIRPDIFPKEFASETLSINRTIYAIGETCRHFKTRIEEHIKKDNKSHIFKHLHSSETCFDSYNSLCFEIIDKANSKFDLKIKEALHINWRKPNLNTQQNHLALTLSL